MTAAEVIVSSGYSIETHREAAAKRINELMHNWTDNTLALGAELTAAAETFPFNPRKPTQPERPGFIKWAKATTGLSEGHISSLLAIHRKFGLSGRKVQLAGNVMRLLVARDVPESARQEALGRSEKGEHIGYSKAKKIAEKHKTPSPKAANQQAKEEGRPVLASDGYIYFGTSDAKRKEGEDRRKMVYGVREALDTLGNIHLTGRQFLSYAFPHQLWTAEEAPIIKKALRWLRDLDDAWDAHDAE